MELRAALERYLPWIEAGLRESLASPEPSLDGHYGMLQYHMGWRDERLRSAAAPAGKRIRPLLCVLGCAAAGGDPGRAVPAATGIELLHNFSLIHDDIEDNSPTRRHRPTVWAVWGLPVACNAGDAMLVLARQAVARTFEAGVPAAKVLEILQVFDATSLRLTEGQFLDLTYEQRTDVDEASYYRMIAGKTGALLGAAPEIGGLVAEADPKVVTALRNFGSALGRAFQLQDDALGIWGDETVTGKPVSTDITSRKKTLPVLYAMADPTVGPQLRQLYAGTRLTAADVPAVLFLLEAAGARAYTDWQVSVATREAHIALDSVASQCEPGAIAALLELLDSLVSRHH